MWRMLLAHGSNVFGSKAWEFAAPLLLLHLSGGNVAVTAVFGIAMTASELTLGPAVGRAIDRFPSRMMVVCISTAIQAVAMLAVLLLLAASFSISCTGQLNGDSCIIWYGGSQPALGCALFLLFCMCGMLEALGRLACTVSVERDWMPTAFEALGEVAFGSVNAKMANVDLLAEIFGPILASLALAIWPAAGFSVIAIINIVSFGPQLALLRAAQQRCKELAAPRSLPEQVPNDGLCSVCSEIATAWPIFLTHPSGIVLLTFSYGLLFFTVLSSHDVVLTAFLAGQHFSPVWLAGFRALGAAFGVLGVSFFDVASHRLGGIRQASGIFLKVQMLLVCAAAVVFTLQLGGSQPAPSWLGGGPCYLLPFLLPVVLSRAGLYGFDVGFNTLSQSLTDERHRGAIGAVTEGLCSAGQLAMYVVSSFIAGSEAGFKALVLASTCAVIMACASFTLWTCMYHEHEHAHGEAGEEDIRASVGHSHGDSGHTHGDHSHSQHEATSAYHVHSHPHTLQQERSLILKDGLLVHQHLHYAGPTWKWLVNRKSAAHGPGHEPLLAAAPSA